MAGECGTAVQIAAGSGRDIIAKGYAANFAPVLGKLLAQCTGLDGGDRIEILLLQGEIQDMQGEWDEAILRYQEILSSSGASRDKRTTADVCRRIGAINLKRAMFDDAMPYLDRSMSLARELDDKHTLLEVYYDMGGIQERRGRFREAISSFTNAKELSEAIGEDVGLGKALYGLGRVHGQLLDQESAIAFKRKALEILERTGDTREIAKVCTSLGNDLWVMGRAEESLRIQERAIDLASASGDLNTVGYAMSNAAASYLEMGDLGRTEEMLDGAMSIFRKLNDVIMIATMHLYRGYLHEARREWEWAKEQFSSALDMLRGLEAPLKLGHWLFEVSQIYAENGERAEARTLLEEALRLASEGGAREPPEGGGGCAHEARLEGHDGGRDGFRVRSRSRSALEKKGEKR
ncbi:MAG: tetratricopeptide repeat protein [Euryarchaeota archaeon]|nr:tetratricopeptide repeat protein [Euryarchaeota archaeon]